MTEQSERSAASPGEPAESGPPRPVPRWTWWEILGLLVSALLVAGPLISLGYAFLFPAPAPAQVLSPTPVATETAPFTSWPLSGTPPNTAALLPTPTSKVTNTPSPGPSPTPTDTPTPGPTVPTVPTVPTDTPTPQPTVPTVPTDTPTPVAPTPTATPPSGVFSVAKAANKDLAYPGETVVFTIGLSNGTGNAVNVTVNDTVPAYFSLQQVRETCTGGTISFSGNSFSAILPVPAGRACQIVATATVVEGCGCYVRNTATWSIPGSGGSASSQPVFLPAGATATRTPPTPVTPAPTFTAGPTWTPAPSFTPGPTWTPAPTFTPGPTWTPAPTFTPSPTSMPTFTPSPGPSATPTATPSAGPSPTPTPPGATVPTATPSIRPTSRPRATPVPDTPGPTPICARARISGEVCVAGAKVTITSCCPQWGAQTTSNASGHFDFTNLTSGVFTVEALGRRQTVTLEWCDSVVLVNLCSLTPGPTALITPPPATPAPTGAVTVVPTVVTPGVQPPTTGDITLSLSCDLSTVSPGEQVTFFLTLHNGKKISALRNIVIRNVFPDVVGLRGATGSSGDAQLLGQQASLAAPLLSAGQRLTLRVDAAIRSDAMPGTTITLQGMAEVSGTAPIYSNFLDLQVMGEGVTGEGTPVLPAGGGAGEGVTPQPTPGGGGLGGELPYTSSGIPMIGIVLGGLVLLVRQARLRRTGRRKQ